MTNNGFEVCLWNELFQVWSIKIMMCSGMYVYVNTGLKYICLSQNYEARIDALQKQVEEQSMTMSMYSSYTADDFTQEDIFGGFLQVYSQPAIYSSICSSV